MAFASLHAHSCYSDSWLTPLEAAALCKRHQVTSAALTDHNTIAGIVEWQRACRKYGIAPIIGAEIDIVPRLAVRATRDTHRLTLLACSPDGITNLHRLCMLARPTARKPLGVTWEDISQHAEGLIALSGGQRGELYLLLESANVEQIDRLIEWYKQCFGDRFALEVRPDFPDRLREALHVVAEACQVPIAAVADVHYKHPREQNAWQALYAPLGAPQGWRHFVSAALLRQTCGAQACEHALVIADRCRAALDPTPQWAVPLDLGEPPHAARALPPSPGITRSARWAQHFAAWLQSQGRVCFFTDARWTNVSASDKADLLLTVARAMPSAQAPALFVSAPDSEALLDQFCQVYHANANLVTLSPAHYRPMTRDEVLRAACLVLPPDQRQEAFSSLRARDAAQGQALLRRFPQLRNRLGILRAKRERIYVHQRDRLVRALLPKRFVPDNVTDLSSVLSATAILHLGLPVLSVRPSEWCAHIEQHVRATGEDLERFLARLRQTKNNSSGAELQAWAERLQLPHAAAATRTLGAPQNASQFATWLAVARHADALTLPAVPLASCPPGIRAIFTPTRGFPLFIEQGVLLLARMCDLSIARAARLWNTGRNVPSDRWAQGARRFKLTPDLEHLLRQLIHEPRAFTGQYSALLAEAHLLIAASQATHIHAQSTTANSATSDPPTADEVKKAIAESEDTTPESCVKERETTMAHEIPYTVPTDNDEGQREAASQDATLRSEEAEPCLLPPDINASEVEDADTPDGRRMGLAGVIGLSRSAAQKIVTERKAHGLYSSVSDIYYRLCRRGRLSPHILPMLYLAGALDSLPHRENLVNEIRRYLSRHAAPPQTQLEELVDLERTPVSPWLMWDLESQRAVWQSDAVRLTQKAELPHAREVVARVAAPRVIRTRYGRYMMFMMLHLADGAVQAVVFPRQFEAVYEIVKRHAVAQFQGVWLPDQGRFVIEFAKAWQSEDAALNTTHASGRSAHAPSL